jgi:hypothetical protein
MKVQKEKDTLLVNVLTVLFSMMLSLLVFGFRKFGDVLLFCAKGFQKLMGVEEQSTQVANLQPTSHARSVELKRDFDATAFVADNVASGQYIPADLIKQINLDPPVANLHLSVYRARKTVSRVMIVTEPRLRGLLKNRRISFPDVPYDPSMGLKQTISDTVKLAQDTINAVGVKVKVDSAKAAKPVAPKVEPVVKQAAHEADKRLTAVETVKVAPKPPTIQMPEPLAREERKFVPRPTVGVTFEGVLAQAGPKTMRPANGNPYEIFEVRLELENGTDVPLRGAELERELSGMSIKLGERIAITPMGKVPVELGDGKQGSKNVYRVERREQRSGR